MAQQGKLPTGWSFVDDTPPTSTPTVAEQGTPPEGWSWVDDTPATPAPRGINTPPPFSFNAAQEPGFNFNQALPPEQLKFNINKPSQRGRRTGPTSPPTQADLANLKAQDKPELGEQTLNKMGIDYDFWKGFSDSLLNASASRLPWGMGPALNYAGKKGEEIRNRAATAYVKGGTIDIPQGIANTVKTGYDILSDPAGTIPKWLFPYPGEDPGMMGEIGDMIARLGSEPEPFARTLGQMAMQPAVMGGTPGPATRLFGRNMTRTGNIMNRYQPFSRTAPNAMAAIGGLIGHQFDGFPGMATGAATGGIISGQFGRGMGWGLMPVIRDMERRAGARIAQGGLNVQRIGDRLSEAMRTPVFGPPSMEPEVVFNPRTRWEVPDIVDVYPPETPVGELGSASGGLLTEAPPPPIPPTQLPSGPQGRPMLPPGQPTSSRITVGARGSNVVRQETPSDWIQLEPPTVFDPMSPSPMHGTSMPMQGRPLPPDPILTQVIKKPSTKVTQQMKERGYSLLTTNKEGAQVWIKRRDVNAPNTPPVGSVLDRKTIPSPSGKIGDNLKKQGYVKESTAKGKETWVKKQIQSLPSLSITSLEVCPSYSGARDRAAHWNLFHQFSGR